MENKPKIKFPIIVEGRYDKSVVMQYFDATVVTLDGFGVFNSKEKQQLLHKLSEKGIIVLCDSDGGGQQIRSFLNRIIPKSRIYNAYIPKIEGKERRKKEASKEGLLGVEGMPRDTLCQVLAPFYLDGGRVANNDEKSNEMITKVDFFVDKLTGADSSRARRDAVCRLIGLPPGMSANALLEALNILIDLEGYRELVKRAGFDE